jgi:hypothetical protein
MSRAAEFGCEGIRVRTISEAPTDKLLLLPPLSSAASAFDTTQAVKFMDRIEGTTKAAFRHREFERCAGSRAHSCAQ